MNQRPLRAPNNRTITLSAVQERTLLQKCLQAKELSQSSKLPHGVVLGDAMELLTHLPPKSVDLLFVDPPYNLTKTFASKTFRSRSTEEYEAFTRAWIQKVLPALKPTASLYVCCDYATGIVLAPLLAEYFMVRNRITWQREKGRGARANWKNVQEDLWFCTVGTAYTFHLEAVKIRRRVLAPYRSEGVPKDWTQTGKGAFRDTCPGNFWDDLTIPYWSMPENTDHPTQKPEKLLAKVLLASTSLGDTVLDPFGGSGTTLAVCEKLGRRCLLIEQEAHYCALAQYRLQTARKNPKIQGFEDGVFWERNTREYLKSQGAKNHPSLKKPHVSKTKDEEVAKKKA